MKPFIPFFYRIATIVSVLLLAQIAPAQEPALRGQKGWCCHEGNIFESTEEQCAQDEGYFFFSKEHAENYCKEHFPKNEMIRVEPIQNMGWCCKDGETFPASPEGCERDGGVFFQTEEQAVEYCENYAPGEENGWCCKNGEFFPSDPEECERAGGMFFGTEEEAAHSCQQGEHFRPERDPHQWRLEVLENLEGIEKYRFNMIMQNTSEFVMDGEFDVAERQLHFRARLHAGDIREAEVFWMGKNAFGYPNLLEEWVKLDLAGEPISYMHALSAFLESDQVIAEHELTIDGVNHIELIVRPDLSPLHENPEAFTNILFRERANFESIDDEAKELFFEIMHEIQIEVRFLISLHSHHIKEIVIESFVRDYPSHSEYHFFDINDPHIQIDPPGEIYSASEPAVPVGALFFNFTAWEEKDEQWGGWCTKLHCKMTDKAINIIKENDRQLQYQEIYKGYPDHWNMKIVENTSYYNPKPGKSEPAKTDHPSVIGSWAEDASGTPRYHTILDKKAMKVPTFRSLNHFGGENQGLQHQWYFKFWGSIPKPPSGSMYTSARDWGLNGGSTGDRMNLHGAINIYNHYTYEANHEAYRRLGHTIHLLQDLAQPDHAALKDHAASSYNEEGAFAEFMVCEAVAAEAFVASSLFCAGPCSLFGPLCIPACASVGAGIAYGGCKALIDKDDVGFEYLTCWNDWNYKLRNLESKLKIERESTTSSQPDPYDHYFKNMADFSIKRAAGFDLPIGLGTIPYAPFILVPGLNPEIDKGEEKPYLELADDVVVKGTNKTAGLFQHFYEVVNHPPYVQEVVVCQTDQILTLSSVTGDVFPLHSEDGLKKVNIIYNGWWECQYGMDKDTLKILEYREIQTKVKDYDPTKYTFILASVTTDMKDFEVTLRDDATGAVILSEKLKKVASSYTMDYANTYHGLACNYPTTAYYGLIVNSAIDICGTLALEFKGEDNEPHFSAPAQGRIHSGKHLDSNPVTVAVADENFPHNWINNPSKQLGYEPGSDKFHKFDVYKIDDYESNDQIINAKELQINSNSTSLISDLTFHSSSDIDYFSVTVPINSDCKGLNIKNLPVTKQFSPSMLQICANSISNIETVIVTVYKDGGEKKYELNTKCNDPFVAESAAYFLLEDNFPNGIIKFKVEPKQNAYKEKVGCYSLKIKHSECSITDKTGVLKK